MELWSVYLIAYIPYINVKFKSICLNLNAQNQVSLLLNDKCLENHAMLEPIDRHILFLEYSSPSSHTGEIL